MPLPSPLLSLLLACARPPVAAPVSAAVSPGDACPRANVFSPVALPKDAWAQRTGADTAKFSALATSQAAPVEVCGVEGQLTWLTKVRCDDGSNPFPSLSAAHGSRLGSTGEGGRCGSIIDLYVVPCPEKKYQVYMDLYVCPA